MYRLNVKKLGFAFGLTGALIYLGCMIVMATAGRGALLGWMYPYGKQD